jgi:thiamine phosphate synthase YjbQ (UPF0047 family)
MHKAPGATGLQHSKGAYKDVLACDYTMQVVSAISDDLKRFQVGLVHIFIQHTSASLTINEVSCELKGCHTVATVHNMC